MTATMIGAMARPAFSPKAHHWGLAFAAALVLHGGLALTLFQPGEPGALASGRGGIEVGLGPAGGAAGAPSEVTPEEAAQAIQDAWDQR